MSLVEPLSYSASGYLFDFVLPKKNQNYLHAMCVCVISFFIKCGILLREDLRRAGGLASIEESDDVFFSLGVLKASGGSFSDSDSLSDDFISASLI
jgi:hypothetical protein